MTRARVERPVPPPTGAPRALVYLEEEVMGYDDGGWGDKGEVRDLTRCQHDPDDGCEWCCRQCNYDRHWCPGCGTVSNHKNEPCPQCIKDYGLEAPDAR